MLQPVSRLAAVFGREINKCPLWSCENVDSQFVIWLSRLCTSDIRQPGLGHKQPPERAVLSGERNVRRTRLRNPKVQYYVDYLQMHITDTAIRLSFYESSLVAIQFGVNISMNAVCFFL